MPNFHPTDIVIAAILASPVVGSFLGVVIERLPAGRQFVWGRSQCDACGHELASLDLIPFASWIWTCGRCRYCGARLSAFYPLIELGAVVMAIWSATVAAGWYFLASCVVGWTLLVAATIEWRKRRQRFVPAIAGIFWLAWLYLPSVILR